MPENSNPDVIYLEADSEITEAIDKLKASHAAEVRLAVPARSAMLQSAINLRLLKKAAQSSHKELVLVSSDKATISLAAGLGLMVAKNVKAEAAIPEAGQLPPESSSEPVIIEQEEPDIAATKAAKNSSNNKNKSSSSGSFEKQHIPLNEEDNRTEEPAEQALKSKSHKNNQPKVPNYMGLNRKIGIGVLAGLGALLVILAYIFLPTAKLILAVDAQKTPVNVRFVLDAGTKRSDYDKAVIAANQVSTTKTLNAEFNATGQKDVGQKASGSVSISNCSTNNSINMPAGTVFSSSGKNFTLNSAVTVPGASFNNGQCSNPGKSNGAVTASQNGDSYNLSNTTFSINGYGPLVTATGSTSGGVSKTVTVVTQSDVESAQKTMIEQANDAAKQELSSKIDEDERVFEGTFTPTVISTSTSAAVGSENSKGTVSAQVKYTQLAVSDADLSKLFDVQIQTQIPGGNQLYQNGSNDADYKIAQLESADKATIAATSTAYYGQTIDTKQVAKSVAGKSKKGAYDILKPQYPQIQAVLSETTPALIPNLPFLANRITVELRVKTD